MTGSRTLSILLAVLIALGPTTAFAQGFNFGSEDVAEASTTDDEASQDDTEGMVFDEGDLKTNKAADERPTVAVVAMPSEYLTPQLRTKLEAKMNEVLKDIPENLYVGSEKVIAALEPRGNEECLREALCFGSVGYEAEVQQILIAQLAPSTSGSGKTLTIDLFDVKDKLNLKYAKQENLTTDDEIVDAVKPLLDNIFDIRLRKKSQYVGPEDTSIINPIIAYTSLGLAVGSLAAGAYFTYAAATADKELKDAVAAKNITQKKAAEDNESIKSKQTLSYVFYGIGGGLAVISVIFFTLDIGSDVSNDEATAGIYDLKLSPVIAPNAAGLTAGFSF